MTLPLLNDPLWARSVTTTVLGDGWPEGNEEAVWNVADRWYALADALTGPRMSALAAADQIKAGLVGAGISPDGFRDTWEKLSGGEDAPLNALVQIAAELGQMVEECGREIEAAKLAAWIEVGTVLTELAGLSIAIELTLGAAAPAVEGLVTASRVAVEQIYARLAARLAGETAARPPAADPAHSARSDQRTIRLTVPGGPTPTAVSAGESRRPAPAADAIGSATATARRRTSGSADDSGIATRRLAPRPRTARRDHGEETRRLVAPARAASGRPKIPVPRSAGSDGHAADRVRRAEYATFLVTLADRIRGNLTIAGADPALAAYADEIESQAARIRSAPPQVAGLDRSAGPALLDAIPEWTRDRPPHGAAPDWARPEPQVPVEFGLGVTPEAAQFRRTAEEQTPGGLRGAHGVHQKALADALPTSDRHPDPRVGRWFSLLNAGGPGEDPTRGVNCLDAVLALFETYQRGLPRVAGARTFDGYAHGAPERAVGGEWLGVRRIQRAARSEFQNLCPFVGGASAEQAEAAVEAAFRNLANHLHNSGYGAFAFILTDFAAGGCHAWAAVNQGGTILFLDPQLGRVSVEEPLYRAIVSMDALVVGGEGEPAPLPYHGTGQWTSI